MTQCSLTTCHYLSQCWPWPVSLCGICCHNMVYVVVNKRLLTRPHGVNVLCGVKLNKLLSKQSNSPHFEMAWCSCNVIVIICHYDGIGSECWVRSEHFWLLRFGGYFALCKWVISQRCTWLVTWFCYHLIAKSGNKTASPSWPDPNTSKKGQEFCV